MLLEIDLDPNEHPSLGIAYARIPCGSDLCVEEIEEEVPPPLVFFGETHYPSCETVESPAFLSQELCEEELTETGGLLSRVVGEFNDVSVKERRAGDRSKAHAGG